MSDKKKIYISGKITGDPNFKGKFLKVENKLFDQGYVVFNPASLPSGLTQKEYMSIGLAMLELADEVYMLPDWYESEGAKVERGYAIKCGIPVTYEDYRVWGIDWAVCCANCEHYKAEYVCQLQDGISNIIDRGCKRFTLKKALAIAPRSGISPNKDFDI